MQFVRYSLKKSTSKNDYQPDPVEKDISDEDIDLSTGLPKKIH